MIKITLKDGTEKFFSSNMRALKIAETISKGLAKEALFAIINGKICDIKKEISTDSTLEIITSKNKQILPPLIRHDFAHLLAEAVQELYKDVKLSIGPDTEYGFFYDFLTNYSFSEEDLPKIENKMREIIKRNEEITRELWNKNKAAEYFTDKKEILKLALLKEIPDSEEITVYKQGNFLDLCRGPHLSSTGLLPNSFKLTKVSSVYWKGDKNSYSLQRIYGIAFLNQKDLDQYETMQKEALARDHRKLAKDMDLFHFQEEAVGQAFWHPKGYSLYLTLQDYIREKLNKHNYIEVKTPQILSRSLWERSGHWEKFSDDIFTISTKEEDLAVKPMNCPAHIEIFKQGLKSYKNLPIRMAEFGSCFRNEPSGSLHGLMRVRGFTQDDAHIFCTLEQVEKEIFDFVNLAKEVYKELLGDVTILVKFSDRPNNRAGNDDIWDKSEKMLYNAARASGLDLITNKGEGAFYGPKLEFTLQDSLGRMWQVGTIQLDFVLPERLGASYIGEDGSKYVPVILHRAILGSFERFIGILLEHYGGKLPLWMAPVQVIITSITNDVDDYATLFYNSLCKDNIRSTLDLRNEKIGYKIREHSMAKIPMLVILGAKEKEKENITIKFLGKEEQKSLPFKEALKYISELCKRK